MTRKIAWVAVIASAVNHTCDEEPSNGTHSLNEALCFWIQRSDPKKINPFYDGVDVNKKH